MVPHNELEKIDEKDKIDEKSTEPAADLGAQKHHVSDQSGSINAMLAEGQKELKKSMIIYPTSTFKVHCAIFVFVFCAIFCAAVERRGKEKEGRRGESALRNSNHLLFIFLCSSLGISPS